MPPNHCDPQSHQQCFNGSCIKLTDVCSVDNTLDENMVLVLVAIGMCVLLLLILLYCYQLQQRSEASINASSGEHNGTHVCGENRGGDAPCLLLSLPEYNDAIDVSHYPPSPRPAQRKQVSVEEPITPPPNYNIALTILAQGQQQHVENGVHMPHKSPPMNRCMSVDDLTGISRSRPMTFSSYGAHSMSMSSFPQQHTSTE